MPIVNLIDETYFKGLINIPNLDKEAVLENLTDEIETYQDIYLKKALGDALYYDFWVGIDQDTQKYKDIRDGKIYQVENDEGNEVNVFYRGLQNTKKRSFLAYFIFFEYVRNNADNFTGHAMVRDENKNATIISIRNKTRKAWNEGLRLYGRHYRGEYNRVEYAPYSDYPMIQPKLAPGQLVNESLYNFIYHMNDQNGDDYYPNWVFTNVGQRNMLL